jgi:hypothetical protein
MRRALWMPALAAAVVTAAGGVTPAPALASCASFTVWHDTAYSQYWSAAAGPRLQQGAALRGAVAPGCNDTGGAVPSPAPVGARAIVGVSPAVAIRSQGLLLVASGYFPQLPGFPLVPRAAPYDATRTCRLGPALTLTGRALPGVGRLVLADVRSSRPERLSDHLLINLEVDVHTRITGLARNGLPYVGEGQRVRIAARRCGGSLVARTITPAGPIVRASTAEDVLGAGWRGGGGVVRRLGGVNRIAAAVALLAVVVLLVLGMRAGRRGSPAPGSG